MHAVSISGFILNGSTCVIWPGSMTLLPTWFEVIHYLALENKCFCEWYVFMMIKHTAHLCTCEVFQQCLKDLKLQPGVSEIYLPVVSYERTCVIHTSSCMGVKETMCKKVWNGIFKVFLVIWHKEKPCTESHWGHSGTYFKTFIWKPPKWHLIPSWISTVAAERGWVSDGVSAL